MRYLILRPDNPIDPRMLTLPSMERLHELAPLFAELLNEAAAVKFVRGYYPGAVAMQIPVAIGSGNIVLLGFLDDVEQRKRVDPERAVPFVMLVQAVAQTDAERARLRQNPASAFDRSLWKVHPQEPDIPTMLEVEVRATDLEVPAFSHAKVGYVDGRLTIYVEIGDIEMSMHFDDRDLKLVDSSIESESKLEPSYLRSITASNAETIEVTGGNGGGSK